MRGMHKSIQRALIALLALAGAAEAKPLRIAVLEFQSGAPAGELDSLGKGLQSMITTDLAQVATFELVERSRLNDLKAELKLAKSSLVDKTTAVKLGKLAGATHLLSGTFTVVGAKMRLDGRLFAVDTGAVLLAEQMEGERDAFFELEKQLVQKIIGAAGVQLQPKERGAVARLHTTDFEAFKRFSQGIALFDEKDYQNAVDALRDAAGRDAEFKLAAVTLAEYQEIIAKIRARADDVETAQVKLAEAGRRKEASAEVQVIEKLYAIADDKGKDAVDRLTALYILSLAFGNVSSDTFHTLKLQDLEDRFVLQRTADGLYRRYTTEAMSLFPKVPAVLRPQFDVELPKDVNELDARFAEAKKSLAGYRTAATVDCPRGDDQPSRILCNLGWKAMRDDLVQNLPWQLLLDGRQRVELYEKLYQMGLKIAGSNQELLAWWRERLGLELANAYRGVMDLDRSTAVLTALAGALKEPDAIRRIADEIEHNKRASELLSKSPNKTQIKEFIALGRLGSSNGAEDFSSLVEDAKSYFGGKVEGRGIVRLNWLRQWPARPMWGFRHDTFLYWGDEPAWLVQLASFTLVTGPRKDPLRAEELRYFDDDHANADTPILVGGAPKKDLTAKFAVSFVPASDWWIPNESARNDMDPKKAWKDKLDKAGRPDVGLIFGARDISVEPGKDAKGKERNDRPMRAYFFAIKADEVQIREMTAGEESGSMMGYSSHRAHTFEHKVLAKQPIDLKGAEGLDVSVEIAGKTLSATINGKRVSLSIPAEHTGYAGIDFFGTGYAAVRAVKIVGKGR